MTAIFSILLNDYVFTPGGTWSDENFIHAGEALSSVLAGEVVINKQQYKYFQLTYNGFEQFSTAATGNGMHTTLLESASVPTARNMMSEGEFPLQSAGTSHQ